MWDAGGGSHGATGTSHGHAGRVLGAERATTVLGYVRLLAPRDLASTGQRDRELNSSRNMSKRAGCRCRAATRVVEVYADYG